MLPPETRGWAFSTFVTGTQFDIQHIADDEPENPQPYWHVQQLTVSELAVRTSYGVRSGMAVELLVPFRVVVDRIHYEDLARQPYLPPNPDLHHRDETLSGISDPQLALHLGHQGKTWSTGGKIGISIPLGKTEPNPFELGRLGLWHQHIQFGTGTWDPVLGFGVGRSFGGFGVEASAAGRLAFNENEHGYRSGNRYAARLLAAHKLAGRWSADGGLLFAHETAETWAGEVETEGNLGRSDLFLSLGVSCATGSRGALFIDLQVPISSRSTGEQVDSSAILTMGWNF